MQIWLNPRVWLWGIPIASCIAWIVGRPVLQQFIASALACIIALLVNIVRELRISQ